jgi:RHS repeat-associated protein
MLVVEVTGGKEYYYHPDHLGSVPALTDSDGGVTDTYDYDAYGNRLASSTGTTYNPFGYTGQYTDVESGLLYLRARYYDPSTQQFLTVDPLVAQTEQAYAYVAGNPTNLTDPSGLQPSPDGIGQWIICMFGFCNPDPLTNPMAIPAQISWQTYQAATNAANAVRDVLSGVGGACAAVWNDIANRWQEAFSNAGKVVETLAIFESLGIPVPSFGIKELPKLSSYDPSQPPLPGWQWRGNGAPGTGQGNWYNPVTEESLWADINHPLPEGPHWDYRVKGLPKNIKKLRIFEDGRIEPVP